MTPEARRIAILAQGSLDFHHGKTAMSLLRYVPDEVVAVIDSKNAGKDTLSVLGFGMRTPIVADVTAALVFDPTELIIGIAPRGGGLPDEWRPQLVVALRAGLTVINGLHTMFNEDTQLVAEARASGARLVDVRHPTDEHRVATMGPRRPDARVVTLVGSDCAVGKMTTALELTAAARRSSLRARFVATGQTGIMITGDGVPLDRVVGDFMAGAIESRVRHAAEMADWVFVEGQGSLLHPGYSGVTLALLHGSQPDGLVLVHSPGHDEIDDYPINIPALSRLVDIYEQAAGWVKPAPVIAIALNTRAMGEDEARSAIQDAGRETGLPTDDPVRFGGAKLLKSITDTIGQPGPARIRVEKGGTIEQ